MLARALPAVWMVLLTAACAPCPVRSAHTEPPPQAVGSAQAVPLPKPVAEPAADELAELVRAPGWAKADDADVFRVVAPRRQNLRLLVADYEQARAEGEMERRVRRFALFAPVDDEPDLALAGRAPWRPLDVVTMELSSGGADPIAEEQRDIDGDGAADLLVHYGRRSLHQEPNFGWVALTSRYGRLLHAPLFHVARPGHLFAGTACWLTVERRPVLVVEWVESREQASPVRRSAAYVVDAAGLAAVRVYGVVAAESAQQKALIPLLGPEPEALAEAAAWVEMVRDCPLTPPGVALAKLGQGFALLSGFSFQRAAAGAHWPSALLRPSGARVVSLEPLQGFAFPAVTDIWR